MVKMPAHYKDFPSDEETLGPQERLALAKIHLRRFCYLCSFQPAYSYHIGTTNVKSYYKKLHEYCLLIEPLPMFQILRTAYESILCRRDEVAVVHAVYLMADLPESWRTELRSHFPTLVKTDADLFLFCKYAAIIHHEKKKHIFCKTVKKAITSWYKNQTPEEIAYMFGANRGKHGFTHRALIRMCRITDSVLGTKYLYQTFTSSCKLIVKHADRPLPPLPVPKMKPAKKKPGAAGKDVAVGETAKQEIEIKCELVEPTTSTTGNAPLPSLPVAKPEAGAAGKDVAVGETAKQEIEIKSEIVEPTTSTSGVALLTAIEHAPNCDQEKIRAIILGVSTLRTTTNAEEALELIQQLDLKYEQLPYHLLQYPQVLKTVVKSMSCSQLVKCLHSEKIRKHFSKQEVLKVCRERFQRKGGMKNECVDPIMFLMSMDRLSIVQPLKPTNNKNTSRGRLVQFSKQLYRTSFWETKPTNLRIHITVNMQQSYMKKVLRNTKSVNYQFAAVALAFTFFKVEEHCDVYRYTEAIHQLLPLNWHKKMDFVAAYQSCSYIQNLKNNQRLYVPIMQANEKNRVYDLFIVIVPSGTRGNKKHCSRTLADYIDKYRIRHSVGAKFVIVDLLRYKRSMRYSQSSCENILEICGLDEHTIPLIYNFALNNFY